MSLNNFSRRLLAAAAAAGDRQVPLHLGKGIRAAIHDLADLAIANGMTQANVHGSNLTEARSLEVLAIILNTNANDCQLTNCLTISTATGSAI